MSSTREHAATLDADPPPRRRWAFLVRPGWIAAIVAAMAFAGTCFLLLAPWQFGRHAERDAQNTAVDAAITAPAVPATDLMSTRVQPSAEVAWRVVTATGEFDRSREVQVRLRQDENGQPVSEVIAPFRLETGEFLLVDRGYVSFADVRNRVPIAVLPSGRVSITGRVQDEQVDPSNRPPLIVGDHVEAYAINVDAIGGARHSEAFLQGYIQLTEGNPGALTAIELPQTDDGPFLSYALQWEVFGIVALVGMGFFVYREAFAPRPADDRRAIGEPDLMEPTGHDADRTGADRTGADRAGAGRTGAPATRKPRRSRDGFDRSQLYDD